MRWLGLGVLAVVVACSSAQNEQRNPGNGRRDGGTTDTDGSVDTDGGGPGTNDGGAGDGGPDHDAGPIGPADNEQCNGIDDDGDGLLAWGEQDLNGDGELDCRTCEAAGFWRALADADDSEVQDRVGELTAQFSCPSYDESRDRMYNQIDAENGQIECVYSGVMVPVGQSSSRLNAEHTWAQSQGANSTPQRCDLHHLFPTVPCINNARGSYPFGVVVNESAGGWTGDCVRGGSKLGSSASGKTVFEPRDVQKGKTARAVLYFVNRYRNRLSNANIDHQLPVETLGTLIEWAKTHQPDAREIARSMAVAEAYGEANPFVVCPGLVERLSTTSP